MPTLTHAPACSHYTHDINEFGLPRETRVAQVMRELETRISEKASPQMRNLIPRAYQALISDDEVMRSVFNDPTILMQALSNGGANPKMRNAINRALLGFAASVCDSMIDRATLALGLKQKLGQIIDFTDTESRETSLAKHDALIKPSDKQRCDASISDDARLDALLKSVVDDEDFSGLLKPMTNRLSEKDFIKDDGARLQIYKAIKSRLEKNGVAAVSEIVRDLESGSLIEDAPSRLLKYRPATADGGMERRRFS